MWGDSYQHTMIAQLLIDNGGLFRTWEPYASLHTFTYHFGFHSAVAVLHWLTGMATPQATLWAGQLLNALAVLALYPLTVRFGGNRWAGMAAVLVAGLLLPMPMFYVNWGRYTQLAGQVVLPAAVVLSWTVLESPRCDWKLTILSWLVTAGLALTHYRVLIFYIVFVLSWTILHLRGRSGRQNLARVGIVGFGAAVLFMPWFLNTFTGKVTAQFARQLAIPPSIMQSVT